MHSLFDNYVQTFVFVVACLLVSALPNIVGIVAWHIGWQTSICCACSVADITTSSYVDLAQRRDLEDKLSGSISRDQWVLQTPYVASAANTRNGE